MGILSLKKNDNPLWMFFQETGLTEEEMIEMVQLLIIQGSSVAIANKNGDNALHMACRSAVNPDCLHILLQAPEKSKALNMANNSGDVPLHLGELPICTKTFYSSLLSVFKKKDPLTLVSGVISDPEH